MISDVVTIADLRGAVRNWKRPTSRLSARDNRAILRGISCTHRRMRECHPGCRHYSCPDCGLDWDDGAGLSQKIPTGSKQKVRLLLAVDIDPAVLRWDEPKPTMEELEALFTFNPKGVNRG